MAGYMYLELGRVAEAIGEYEAAVKLDSTKPQYHWNLAEAYRRAGNVSAARLSYAKSAVADNSYAPKVEERLQMLK